MALEPITRQEKIIAGQDLTPITRMEKFLKNFGGGSGASVQSDWNQNDAAVSDYIKNRPFYTCDTEEVMLPETTITIEVGPENTISSNFPYTFEVGKTYVITFDGVDTEYTAYQVERLVYIGYDFSSISDGSGYVVTANNGYAVLITSDPSFGGSHTIAIKRYTQEIKKLDEKFIPDVSGLTVKSSTTDSTKKFKITVDDGGTISATEVT